MSNKYNQPNHWPTQGIAQTQTYPPLPEVPPAFIAPILLEDGSLRAVVVDERWRNAAEPRPLLTTEQAQAVVDLLNAEWEEQQRAKRAKEEEMIRQLAERAKIQEQEHRQIMKQYNYTNGPDYTSLTQTPSLTDRIFGAVKNWRP